MCIKAFFLALSAVASLFLYDAATRQGLVVFDGFPQRHYSRPSPSPTPSYHRPTTGDFAAFLNAATVFNTSNLSPSEPLSQTSLPDSQYEAPEAPTYEPVTPSPNWITILLNIIYKLLHLENRLYWTVERVVWLFLLATVTKLENERCDIAYSHIIQIRESDQDKLRQGNTELEQSLQRLNEDTAAMAVELDEALGNLLDTNQRLSISEADLANLRQQHAELLEQSESKLTASEAKLESIQAKLNETEQELGRLRALEDKACKAQELSHHLEKELKSRLDEAKKQQEKMSKDNSAKMRNLEKRLNDNQQAGKKTTQELQTLTAKNRSAGAEVERLQKELSNYQKLQNSASKAEEDQAVEIAELREQIQEAGKATKRLNSLITNYEDQQSNASTSADIQAAEITELKKKNKKANDRIGHLTKEVTNHQAQEQKASQSVKDQAARIDELCNEIHRAEEEIDSLKKSVTESQAQRDHACKVADEETSSNELLRGELDKTQKMLLDFEAKHPVVTPAEAAANAANEELEGMKLALAESRAEMQALAAQPTVQHPPRQNQFISPMERSQTRGRVLTLKEEEVEKAAAKVAARQKELEDRGIMPPTVLVADEARASRVDSYKLGFQNTMLKEAKVALMEAEKQLRAVNDSFAKRSESLGTDILHYKDALENHYRPALAKAGLPQPRRPVGSINPHLYGHCPPFGFQSVSHQPAHPSNPAVFQQQYQPQYQLPPHPAFPQPFAHQFPSPPPGHHPQQQQHQLMPQAPEFRPQAPTFIPQAPDTTNSREQCGQPSRSQPRHQQPDGNNPGLVKKEW